MESPNSRLITLAEADAEKLENKKRDILSKGKLSIQIPYQSSGVGDVAIGSAVFGKNGAILGALNEGETKWKYTELILIDGGARVKSTGTVVLYNDIKRVVLGDSGFVHTIVTIVADNNNGLICKVENTEAKAFKSIIEDHIQTEKTSDNNLEKLNDDADILLKYADLFERGFITKEEFNLKKQEIFNNKREDNVILKSDPLPTYCGNCGSIINDDSNFCTNCGFKIRE